MKKIKTTVQVKDFDIVDLHDLGSHSVVMSNVIIRSAQTLSLIEKRILMACISKMKDRTVELSASEYAKTYDIDLNKAYQHLKRVHQTSLIGTLLLQLKTVNVLASCGLDGFHHRGILMAKGE